MFPNFDYQTPNTKSRFAKLERNYIPLKVCRIKSIPIKQNRFQNNSREKNHRGLDYTLIDTQESIHVAN